MTVSLQRAVYGLGLTGIQFIGPLGPLDTCSEVWIDEELWLVNK